MYFELNRRATGGSSVKGLISRSSWMGTGELCLDLLVFDGFSLSAMRTVLFGELGVFGSLPAEYSK